MTTLNLFVNLLGAPGVGKSTAAAAIYAELKRHHIDCELVTDFAKDMIIQGNKSAMDNQLYVWASQLYRNTCAYKRARVTVTDTPILLGCIYNKPLSPHLREVIFEQHHKHNNLNLIVPRQVGADYSMFGRIHTEVESFAIDTQIVELLTDNDISYEYYDREELASLCADIISLVT